MRPSIGSCDRGWIRGTTHNQDPSDLSDTKENARGAFRLKRPDDFAGTSFSPLEPR